MPPEIEALKRLADQKITKGKLQALQKAHADADALFERLYPKSDDEDTTTDFDDACEDVESALDELDSAINDLGCAKDMFERQDAISMIEDALEQTVSAFDTVMPFVIVGTTPCPAPSRPSGPGLDPELTDKVLEISKLPEQDRAQALAAWIASAPTPALVQDRQEKLDQFFAYIQKMKQTPTPPPS
jgi:hypothetical protein